MDIDEAKYSRQINTYGKGGMRKLYDSRVLVSGMGGAGLELAKCLVLAGVHNLVLHTEYDVLEPDDLGVNFYGSPDGLGSPYLDKIVMGLRQLNEHCQITAIPRIVPSDLAGYRVAVFCDYNPYDLIYWNRLCREQHVGFVMLSTYGLAGNVFCDFGDAHLIETPDGEAPREGMIVSHHDGIVATAEPHGLYQGDVIGVRCTRDNTGDRTNIRVTKRINSHKLRVDQWIDPRNGVRVNTSYVQIIAHTSMRFKSLAESLVRPDFIGVDGSDPQMPMILNAYMQARAVAGIACDWSVARGQFVLGLASHGIAMTPEIEKTFQLLEMVSGFGQSHTIGAITAVIGSIGAQEAIKCITNRFTPTRQFLHFEALGLLGSVDTNYLAYREANPADFVPSNRSAPRAHTQIKIFGSRYIEHISQKHVFVVGAGAIGCEHLKNLSLMGVGRVTVTDMDSIEYSNLSRQFLFTRDDIGKPKSVVATERAMRMNPRVQMVAHQNKISSQADQADPIYTREWFGTVDCIASALDNVEARLAVDQMATRYAIAMLESGTLGTKGSIQTIVPHLTQSYGSFADQAEQSIPLCTLKMFPYKYEHLVQYAMDSFEGWFSLVPQNIRKILDRIDQPDRPDSADRPDIVPDEIQSIYSAIQMARSTRFEDVLEIATSEWHRLFVRQIEHLIAQYPATHRDEQNNPFWSGTKKFPQPARWDPHNPTHAGFVGCFARILAQMIRIDVPATNQIDQMVQRISTVHGNPIDLTNPIDLSDPTPEQLIDLATQSKPLLARVQLVPFEKDDPTNSHVDLITHIANLRASNYGIEPKDRHESMEIAGKIIPALATTTTLVSGLVCLEMYKVFCNNTNLTDISRYRDGSFNLAIQSFGLGHPVPVRSVDVTMNGTSHQYNIWSCDRIGSNARISELVAMYHGIEYKGRQMTVGVIVQANKTIYMNTPAYDHVLDRMVSELCKGDELGVVMEQIEESDDELADNAPNSTIDDLVIRCVIELPTAGYME
jgi:ubiquitin-activating enzyme E1